MGKCGAGDRGQGAGGGGCTPGGAGAGVGRLVERLAGQVLPAKVTDVCIVLFCFSDDGSDPRFYLMPGTT